MCDGASWIAAGMGIASLVTGGIGYASQQSAIAQQNSFNSTMAMFQNQSNTLNFMQQMQNFKFQNQEAEKQLDFQARMLALQRQEAVNAADIDFDILTEQKEQIDEGAITDKLERIRQGQRERALMRVAAAEAGVGGITPEVVQTNLLFQQGYDTALIEQERTNKVEQLQQQGRKVMAEAESRIRDTWITGTNAGFNFEATAMNNWNELTGSWKPMVSAQQTSSLNPLLEGFKIGTSSISSGLSTYSSLSSLSSASKKVKGG